MLSGDVSCGLLLLDVLSRGSVRVAPARARSHRAPAPDGARRQAPAPQRGARALVRARAARARAPGRRPAVHRSTSRTGGSGSGAMRSASARRAPAPARGPGARHRAAGSPVRRTPAAVPGFTSSATNGSRLGRERLGLLRGCRGLRGRLIRLVREGRLARLLRRRDRRRRRLGARVPFSATAFALFAIAFAILAGPLRT